STDEYLKDTRNQEGQLRIQGRPRAVFFSPSRGLYIRLAVGYTLRSLVRGNRPWARRRRRASRKKTPSSLFASARRSGRPSLTSVNSWTPPRRGKCACLSAALSISTSRKRRPPRPRPPLKRKPSVNRNLQALLAAGVGFNAVDKALFQAVGDSRLAILIGNPKAGAFQGAHR